MRWLLRAAVGVTNGLQASRGLSLLLLASLLWTASAVVAPFTLPHGTVHLSEDGGANRIDNADAYAGFNPLAAGVYTLADIECHQLPDRSLTANGNQMPLCVRCLALFVFANVGLLLASRARPEASLAQGVLRALPRRVRDGLTSRLRPDVAAFLVIAFLAAPAAVDGFTQLPGWRESTNVLRAVTGALAGIAGGLFVGVMATSAGVTRRSLTTVK